MRTCAKRLAAVLLCFVSYCELATAQGPAKPTPPEARAAERLARQFSKRLLQTKDVSLLIQDSFVVDFPKGYLDDENPHRFPLLDVKLARRLSLSQLRRYFSAELNWFYLNGFYVLSKMSSSSSNERNAEEVYSAAILRAMRSNTFMKAVVDEVEITEADLPISSVENYRSFSSSLEAVAHLLRRSSRSINAGRTSQYREALEERSIRYSHFQPQLSICEERCLGFPVGTRFVVVNVPLLQLTYVRVKGRMKIAAVYYYYDD